MRSFSRHDENETPEQFELNELLEETVSLIGNQFSKNNLNSNYHWSGTADHGQFSHPNTTSDHEFTIECPRCVGYINESF